MRYFAYFAAISILAFIPATAQAQKRTPDYKIEAIKVIPFNEATGKFEDEWSPKSERFFFNDLSTSLFVTIVIAGEAGSFADGRKVSINVTEGRKIKFSKTEQVGLIGDGGRYFVPVFLYGSMCDDIKITARLLGQRAPSAASRSVPFECGE